MKAKSIASLRGIASNLPGKRKELFDRIYGVSETDGRMAVPGSMQPWVKKRFGSVKAVEQQKIIRVDNWVTGESALFNALRSLRPKQGAPVKSGLPTGKCLFCSPGKNTPEDVFGRIRGRHCITASNVAKYDKWHGLVIFNEHNPFRFNDTKISDYLNTSMKWFGTVMEHDAKARHPFFMWNCLWRAGASIIHGHAQVTVSEKPYARFTRLASAAKRYNKKHKSGYFDDVFLSHKAVGLGMKNRGARVMAYMTPVKDNEIVMISDDLGRDFAKLLDRIMRAFFGKSDRGFNLSIIPFPLYGDGNTRGEWEGLPYITRLVERGLLEERNSDIGSMELHATTVISTDPFKTIRMVKSALS